LLINSHRDLNQFDFIIYKVIEGLPDTQERKPHTLHNIVCNFTTLNNDLSRKTFEKNGWKMFSQFKSPSQFTPKSVNVDFLDRSGVTKTVIVNDASNESILFVLDKFYEITEFFNWSHYDLIQENKKLKDEVERLKFEINNLKNNL